MGASEKVWATFHGAAGGWTEALRRIEAHFRQFKAAALALGMTLDRYMEAVLDKRILYGRRNFRPDGTWVSDMCSAWLHDSCELPDQCCCTARGCHNDQRRKR